MSLKIKLGMFFFSIILALFVSYILKKEKMPVKYSIVWYLAAFIILLAAIVPNFLISISSFLGFEALSSMITGLMIIILLSISMVLTVIISNQKRTIVKLIQEVSIIKGKINEE
ncbi:MAG: DUF2304 domain-containing protein [Bacilli bacterium]|nr:DUF2304 domain-containing protein [Bacilli bacterium]